MLVLQLPLLVHMLALLSLHILYEVREKGHMVLMCTPVLVLAYAQSLVLLVPYYVTSPELPQVVVVWLLSCCGDCVFPQ